LENSNFFDEENNNNNKSNKENETVICVSNLDMKIDDSNFAEKSIVKNPNLKFDGDYLRSLNTEGESDKKNMENNNNYNLYKKITLNLHEKCEEIKNNVNNFQKKRDEISFPQLPATNLNNYY